VSLLGSFPCSNFMTVPRSFFHFRPLNPTGTHIGPFGFSPGFRFLTVKAPILNDADLRLGRAGADCRCSPDPDPDLSLQSSLRTAQHVSVSIRFIIQLFTRDLLTTIALLGLDWRQRLALAMINKSIYDLSD
jgi:hypothetical protein